MGPAMANGRRYLAACTKRTQMNCAPPGTMAPSTGSRGTREAVIPRCRRALSVRKGQLE